jgi:hypothetical protein
MGIVIKKYGDLTTPTPAYGGRVWTCFSPKAAISRAIGHALKQVKGKRWSTVRATISVVEMAEEISLDNGEGKA